jgi:hypothetical protein
MGPTVQLDDYPYVHFQLMIDEELAMMDLPRMFHHPCDMGGRNGPFINAYEWPALVQLLNDDYHEIRTGKAEQPERAARRLFERIDRAAERAGGEAKLEKLPAEVLAKLEAALEPEAREIFNDKAANIPDTLEGKTIVIEFARGGPVGSMPLPPYYGYASSLANCSEEMLANAAILYVWGTPEESRRKNRARARPGEDASILFHGSPESVMLKDYGCDDMEYLIETSDKPGTLRIEAHDKVFHIPVERIDNRVDLTTFVREEPATWNPADVERLDTALLNACTKLWARLKESK